MLAPDKKLEQHNGAALGVAVELSRTKSKHGKLSTTFISGELSRTKSKHLLPENSKRESDGVREVLKSNALIATLFFTTEIAQFVDCKAYQPWRRRVVLYTAVAAVLLHVTTVLVATEAEFVFQNIDKNPSQALGLPPLRLAGPHAGATSHTQMR